MDRTSEWLSSFHNLSQNKNKTIKIAITGGKGGVGKTSIALGFARGLAEKSRVLLIDCDTNLSNTGIKLGLPLQDTFGELLRAEKTFEESVVKLGQLDLLMASNGSLDLFENELSLSHLIMDIINTHESEYDYILLDCPAGLGRETLDICAYCDQRIIVLNPDKSSITDAYSLTKLLNKKYSIIENTIIVNKFDNKDQLYRVVKTFGETVENFLGCRTNYLGSVPRFQFNSDKFDEEFVLGKNDRVRKVFVKLVANYSERFSERKIRDFQSLVRTASVEQEVRPSLG